jgi:hypothetical protein
VASLIFSETFTEIEQVMIFIHWIEQFAKCKQLSESLLCVQLPKVVKVSKVKATVAVSATDN